MEYLFNKPRMWGVRITPPSDFCFFWFQSCLQVDREHGFLWLYLESDKEPSQSYGTQIFCSIDFNITTAIFQIYFLSWTVYYYIFKEQHLSVSSIKNVWDKSESWMDLLFTLPRGLNVK